LFLQDPWYMVNATLNLRRGGVRVEPDRCTTVILNPQSRLVWKRTCRHVITDVSKVTANSNNFIYAAWRREVKGTDVPGRWAQTEVHYI
jgi:hypothetical protein